VVLKSLILAGCLTAFISSAAIAKPPPIGSEDWEIMAPFVEWVQKQNAPDGHWCCDVSDGRPVESRMHNGHWQIYITEEKFARSTTGWADVPDSAILHQGNPVGVAIAWVIGDHIYCFAPASLG
jgi:hypothetical protein